MLFSYIVHKDVKAKIAKKEQQISFSLLSVCNEALFKVQKTFIILQDATRTVSCD